MMAPTTTRYQHRGRPTDFDRALELSKIAWADVLNFLGREVRFGEFDSKPYQVLEPFHYAKELLEQRVNGGLDQTVVRWLTVPEIERIHDEMIRSFGGEPGVRNIGAVSSAIERARFSTVHGEDFAPTIIHKAATIMHQILVYHPFVDGQKRTGISSAFIFLGLNGYFMWSREAMDEVHFAVRVAKGEYDVPEISRWLAARVVPLKALSRTALPSEFLRFASKRRRQCSACRSSMNLDAFQIKCRACGVQYNVVINSCLVKRQKGQNKFIVDLGIRMIGG